MRKLVAGLGMLAALAGTAGAQTNLIGNGDFEGVTHGSWAVDVSGCNSIGPLGLCEYTFSGLDANDPGMHQVAYDGTRSYQIEAMGAVPFTLDQAVTVDKGTTYIFSAFIGGATPFMDLGMSTCTPGGSPNVVPLGRPNTVMQCTATVTGSVAARVGIIGGANNQNVFGILDDVALTPVPEPSALALLGTGLLALVPASRRRRV